ncbi:MAG: OmpA family protein [Planctomycetes bacterium]|nr:OmpA family protein [Planctomycetota bacterium]
MNRPFSVFALFVVVAGLLLATGCDDSKQRIALLEDDNQRLIDELGMARNDCDACRGNLQMCEQELATVRADGDDLRGQLAGLRDQLAAQPEVPEGWQAVPGGAMIALEGKVLFDFAKTELRSEARARLDAIARTVASQYAASDILVYGHTDDVQIGPSKNKWKDNLELSAQRALAVVRYLQGRGVDPTTLVAAGCGEYRPIVPNNSTTNRDKNRRVEIYALDTVVQSAGR